MASSPYWLKRSDSPHALDGMVPVRELLEQIPKFAEREKLTAQVTREFMIELKGGSGRENENFSRDF